MDTMTLRTQFGLSASVMERNLEGISHEESLRRPGSGSSLNWVLGHVVRTRNEVLPLIGADQPYAMDDFDPYRADPQGAEGAFLSLDDLAERFTRLQATLDSALVSVDPETLAEPAPFSPTDDPHETVGSLLALIAYHEAYHAGQIGLIRRVLGKPGAISAE